MEKRFSRWLPAVLLAALPASGLPAGDLHNAAEEGDAVAVRRLIAYGAEVDARDEAGRTPLHVAARGTSAETVGVLLERHADVNARDNEGKTPLHLARRSVAVVNLLLNFGADVNAKTPDSLQTPLHLLLDAEDSKIVPLLLDRGADLNARDNEGRTPLHYAAMTGSPELVRTLVEAGADREARDAEGRTPADLARTAEKEDNAWLLESPGE